MIVRIIAIFNAPVTVGLKTVEGSSKFLVAHWRKWWKGTGVQRANREAASRSAGRGGANRGGFQRCA
jgi:hypothetical protein